MPPLVTAVIVGSAAGSPATEEALADQHDPPQGTLHASGLRDGVSAAAATDPRWIWLLDDTVVPAPGALGSLLQLAAEPGALPAPVVLASKVVDAAGGLHPVSRPQHAFRDHEAALDACGQRLMAIRAAHSGSVLIRADVVARFGLPRRELPAAWGMFAWTAGILRHPGCPGYLMPESLAERLGAPVPRPGEYRSRLRMLAGRTWSPDEWRREAYVLAVDVMGAPRRARRA